MAELAAQLHQQQLDNQVTSWGRDLNLQHADSNLSSTSSLDGIGVALPGGGGRNEFSEKDVKIHETGAWRLGHATGGKAAGAGEKKDKKKVAAVSRWLKEADLGAVPPSPPSLSASGDAEPAAPVIPAQPGPGPPPAPSRAGRRSSADGGGLGGLGPGHGRATASGLSVAGVPRETGTGLSTAAYRRQTTVGQQSLAVGHGRDSETGVSAAGTALPGRETSTVVSVAGLRRQTTAGGQSVGGGLGRQSTLGGASTGAPGRETTGGMSVARTTATGLLAFPLAPSTLASPMPHSAAPGRAQSKLVPALAVTGPAPWIDEVNKQPTRWGVQAAARNRVTFGRDSEKGSNHDKDSDEDEAHVGRPRRGDLTNRSYASSANSGLSRGTTMTLGPRRHTAVDLELISSRGGRRRRSWWLRLRERMQAWHPLVVADAVLPIFNPDHPYKRGWDILVMSMVMWTAVTVPLSVSYGLPHSAPWAAADYAMTCLFAVDLVVNFRTAFYNFQGELIRDSGAIARNYMKFWFWIDLVGTIPFDSIILWTGVLSGGSDTSLAAIGFLKAPRLLRLGRLLRFLDGFKHAKIFRIVQLFLIMLLISHWLACIWYMMYIFGGYKHADNWAFLAATEDEEDKMIFKYVVSYYYSFLLLVGDNIPVFNNYERVFYTVVEMLGIFFYSAIVGQMATLVATMNVAVNRHAQKGIMTQDTLRYCGVPDAQCEAVQQYFDWLQLRSHPGAEGMSFLTDLPASMFRELHMYMYMHSVSKVPLFANLENGFLRALATRVSLTSMTPSEWIFRVGDVGHCMYIIKKGNVAVTSARCEIISLLGPGDIFGEVALLSTGKRTANCTALGFVDLAVLTKQDLAVVMHDYPYSAALIRQRAAEKMVELSVTRKIWLPGHEDDVGMEHDQDRQRERERRDAQSRAATDGDEGDEEEEEEAEEEEGKEGLGTSPKRAGSDSDGSGSSGIRRRRPAGGAGLAGAAVGDSSGEGKEGGSWHTSGDSSGNEAKAEAKHRPPPPPAAPLPLASAPVSSSRDRASPSAPSLAPAPGEAPALAQGPAPASGRASKEQPRGSPEEDSAAALRSRLSHDSQKQNSRVYWRSIDIARPTDVLQLTPRAQAEADARASAAATAAAAAVAAVPPPPSGGVAPSSRPGTRMGPGAGPGPGRGSGVESGGSSRPESKRHWRSIDIARPTDVLQLTPRNEALSAPPPPSPPPPPAAAQIGAAAPAWQARPTSAGSDGSRLTPSRLASGLADLDSHAPPSSQRPARPTSGRAGSGAGGILGVDLASIFSSSLYAPSRRGSGRIVPERINGSPRGMPPPPGGAGGTGPGAAAAAAAGAGAASSSVPPGLRAARPAATGPGPVAEALLDSLSPPASRGVTQQGVVPAPHPQPHPLERPHPHPSAAPSPDPESCYPASSGPGQAASFRTARTRRASSLGVGLGGGPPGAPHRAFATPSPGVGPDDDLELDELAVPPGLRTTASGHRSMHGHGHGAALHRTMTQGGASSAGLGGGRTTGGVSTATTGTGMVPASPSITTNGMAGGRTYGASRRSSTVGVKASQNLNLWYMEQLQISTTSPRDLVDERTTAGGGADGGGGSGGGGYGSIVPASPAIYASQGGHAHGAEREGRSRAASSRRRSTLSLAPPDATAGAGLQTTMAALAAAAAAAGLGLAEPGSPAAATRPVIPRLPLASRLATAAADPAAAAAAAAVVDDGPHFTDEEPQLIVTVSRRAPPPPAAAGAAADSSGGGGGGGDPWSPVGRPVSAAPAASARGARALSRATTVDERSRHPTGLGSRSLRTGRSVARRVTEAEPPSPPPPPPPPVHVYVPAAEGGAKVQRLPDGGYYVCEEVWDALQTKVLGGLETCEAAVTDLAMALVRLDENVTRLEEAQAGGAEPSALLGTLPGQIGDGPGPQASSMSLSALRSSMAGGPGGGLGGGGGALTARGGVGKLSWDGRGGEGVLGLSMSLGGGGAGKSVTSTAGAGLGLDLDLSGPSRASIRNIGGTGSGGTGDGAGAFGGAAGEAAAAAAAGVSGESSANNTGTGYVRAGSLQKTASGRRSAAATASAAAAAVGGLQKTPSGRRAASGPVSNTSVNAAAPPWSAAAGTRGPRSSITNVPAGPSSSTSGGAAIAAAAGAGSFHVNRRAGSHQPAPGTDSYDFLFGGGDGGAASGHLTRNALSRLSFDPGSGPSMSTASAARLSFDPAASGPSASAARAQRMRALGGLGSGGAGGGGGGHRASEDREGTGDGSSGKAGGGGGGAGWMRAAAALRPGTAASTATAAVRRLLLVAKDARDARDATGRSEGGAAGGASGGRRGGSESQVESAAVEAGVQEEELEARPAPRPRGGLAAKGVLKRDGSKL
ncbi:hypothetical protein HYH03_015996 [Edaphochlamys debaryana]|uniref:Cyclic nucleotide-binding domain-containing protein n=1 Tax=Edaphochlamys debaryana TaxID=47281 RepID=A0A835XSH6_9CHLO|nr:hypothetical protein HYH03_015996 [Edaphochlamys debaryana]|eukprot:KAG2485209.1 hypothetical protein HYH03_015996 [Edaphochlamys debaryana]